MLKQLLLAFCFVCSAWGASLEWNASVVDEQHAAPTGYRLHRGPAPGAYDWQIDVGNVLQWPIPDDLYGEYYWSASAYNASGSSGYSNEVYFTRDAPPVYVGATGVSASKLSNKGKIMPLQLIASTEVSDWASGTTLNTSADIDVLAGDLLIAVAMWESNDSTATIADTDSVNTFTMLPVNQPGYGDSLRIGYVLSAAANDNSIFRMTTSGSVIYRMFFVFQFRPDSGDTVTLDAGPSDSYATASTSLTTASIDPSGTDTLIFVAWAATGGAYGTLSSAQIGGSDATLLNSSLAEGSCFFRLVTSDLGSINGTATISHSSAKVLSILSFVSAAGGGSSAVPKIMILQDHFSGGIH